MPALATSSIRPPLPVGQQQQQQQPPNGQQYPLMTPNISQPQQPAKPAATQELQLPSGDSSNNNNNSQPNIPQTDGSADSEMTTEVAKDFTDLRCWKGINIMNILT